ncbi:MAG: HlyD family secretion protein, partial [Mesorhizobium sp.]
MKAIPLDTKPQSLEQDVEPVNETREQPAPVRESHGRPAEPRQERPDGNASQRKAGLLGFPRRHPYATAAIALALLLVAAGVAMW